MIVVSVCKYALLRGNIFLSLKMQIKDKKVFIYYICTILFVDMTEIEEGPKPLVYSCSGCSSAAQMANYLAIQLDRKGIAEMSCIAGVGGNVKSLVRTAKSGRKLIAIDGCPLSCVKACLSNHSLQPDMHFELKGMGVAKKRGEDFDKTEAEEILEKIGSAVELRLYLQSEKEMA